MATMYIVKKNIESAGEMGPLAGSQVRELVQSGELTAGDLIRNVNSQNWVRIDSVPQLASELSKPKSSPKNKDVDLEHPQQVQLNPDQAKGVKSSLLQEGSSPTFTHAETLKTNVAEDGVLPPSSGFSARMKKTVLGVAMVVVFCITWLLVAGHAWQAAQQAEQTANQAEQAYKQAEQAYKQAEQADQQARQAFEQASQAFEQASQAYTQASKAGKQEFEQAKQAFDQASQPFQQTKKAYIEAEQAWDSQAFKQAKRAYDQAVRASIMADAHFRTQGSWGIGAALLADVLLLVGALAWSKLTAKP